MKFLSPVRIVIVTLALVLTTQSQTTSTSDREIQFTNGDIRLAATLSIPNGKGPFPAVVIVHGSGESDRTNAWTSAYAKGLSARGVAVLHPDKRGSGKSKGVWKTASFEVLAKDAISAVEFLRNEPLIDKDRIGLIGFSQGGHIVPLAAQAPGIAFAIDVSGSVVPMFEQIEDEVIAAAERAQLTSAQIEIVRDINRKGLAAASTGKNINEYVTALASAGKGDLKGHPILKAFPTSLEDPRVASIRAIGNFDPMPYWQKLAIPIAFVFGGQDTQIRVSKTMRLIDENLTSNKRNTVVMFFSSNGHGIYRDDVIAFLAEWISRKGVD